MTDPTTPLQTAVHNWYQSQVEDDYTTAIDDLLQNGCQSGMVSDLIYYTDTTAFFQKHEEEIYEILRDYADEGLGYPEDYLRGWDKSDPFAKDTNNQNLLAWFGFEETARRMHE